MLNRIAEIANFYGTTLRRNRELYFSHCLRVASCTLEAGLPWKCVELALLHDILELDNVTYIDTLDDIQKGTLNILTAYKDESSQDHFLRVLNSGDIWALVIKYYDNLDNSVFTDEDKVFTEKVLHKDSNEEIQKYLTRAKMIKEKLFLQGVFVG